MDVNKSLSVASTAINGGQLRSPPSMDETADSKPDRRCLAAYRAGRVEALGELVEHYRRPLYGFILRMMEGHMDAEEIFQETWLRAVRHLPTYREDRFLSWLFRIAHNLVIDRARKARPMIDLHGRDESDEADPIQTQLAGKAIDPAVRTAGRDLGDRIRAAVASLPEDQREVFLLRTEADIPFKEIARMQGTSINTALARMHYAVKKLRVELNDEYKHWQRG